MTAPTQTRRGLLKGGAALGTVALLALPVAVVPKAETCTVDPAFAAIDTLKACWAEVLACVEDQGVYDRARQKLPDDLEERINAAHDRCGEAREMLLETVPTTMAGMLAMLEIIDEPAGWGGMAMDEWEFNALHATFRAFLTAGGANG